MCTPLTLFVFCTGLLLIDAKGCSTQSECNSSKSCVQRQCVDPCLFSCGPNTVCTVKNHKAQCKCRPGYSGDVLAGCVPSCGILTKLPTQNQDVKPLINKGKPTEEGEFPWLTAIFLKDANGRWTQQCGGTLITPHVVVTAAHCLKPNAGALIAPNEVMVGLGKYYRDYYRKENHSVIASVREVLIPENYNGDSSSYALDIGLLDLTIKIEPSTYIMPACLDFENTLTVNNGDECFISGWGTTETGSLSETILSARLSYMGNSECISKLQLRYRRYLTHDKFCAGGEAGEHPDKGDSGGGLTVSKNGVQHLLGVVSTKIIGESSFSLFTNIQNTEHQIWLQRQIDHLSALVIVREVFTYNIEIPLSNRNPISGCSTGSCWPPKTPGKVKRYYFNQDEVTWFEALYRCRNMGRQLAIAETREEAQMLLSAFNNAPDAGSVYRPGAVGHWVGGSDVQCEEDWRWIPTDQQINMNIFTFLDDGWPNNDQGREHCLEVYKASNGRNTLWNDVYCGLKRKFICESYE